MQQDEYVYPSIIETDMPPKKKEEEIDLSTLPQWTSRNVILLCSGSQQRSSQILSCVKATSNKMVRFIDQTQVIEHAKVKQLYVDVATLTDKQKKELKPDIPTELTGEVKAKALSSLINQLNVENRVDRKAKQDAKDQPPDPKKINKKESKKDEKGEVSFVEKQYTKVFDSVYILERYPETVNDFVETAKEGEGVNYVINIQPNLIYPEEDEEEGDEEEEGNNNKEQEETNKDEPPQLKPPKIEREVTTQEDTLHNNQIGNLIQNIKAAKKVTPPDSEFRNCLIRDLKFNINVESEAEQIKQLPETIFEYICELSVERSSYDEWLKTKKKKEFATQEVKEEQRRMNLPSSGSETPLQLLLQIAHGIEDIIEDSSRVQQSIKMKDYSQIQDLFEESIEVGESRKSLFKGSVLQQFNENYFHSAPLKPAREDKSIFSYLLLPGVNRTLMPQIPEKSYHKRRQEESTYTNFLQCPEQNFSRIRDIVEFQKLFQTVESGRYTFNDRVYQEYHNKDSIVDTFSKIFLHDPEVFSRYDEYSDSLLVGVLFRNPEGLVNYRRWTSDWRTLPNFENWFNHFKSSESNMKSSHFYTLDDLKLGKVEEIVKEVTPGDGSVVIHKAQEACDQKRIGLKVIKDDHVLGLKNLNEKKEFWYHNNGHRVSVMQKEGGFEVIITLMSGLIIVVNERGHVYQRLQDERRKTLPTGFTILYEDEKEHSILHPNGGVTSATYSYVNPEGLGIVLPNTLIETPTLKRTTPTHTIVKRNDDTVIIDTQNARWIKFYDNTIFQFNNGVRIEKKGFAQGQYQSDLEFVYAFEDVEIRVRKGNQEYEVSVGFKDRSEVGVKDGGVYCVAGSMKSRTNNNSCFLEGIESGFYRYSFGEEEIVYVMEKDNKLHLKLQDIGPENTPSTTEYPLGSTSIQPRLFIVRNDNTAIELLSEGQLATYFSQKEQDPNAQIKRTKEERNQLVQVMSKIYPRPQVTPVRPKYPPELDILPIPSVPISSHKQQVMTMRILSKFSDITPSEREQFDQTLQKQSEWKSETIKQDNQFGYKQMTQQMLDQETVFRTKMIEKRREPLKEFPYDKLRDALIQSLVKKILLKEERETDQFGEIDLMKKKSSMVEPQEESRKETQGELKTEGLNKVEKSSGNISTPYCPCRHYFDTPQGAEALKLMPKDIFDVAPEVLSNQASYHTDQLYETKSFERNTLKSAPHIAEDMSQLGINTVSPIPQINEQGISKGSISKKEIVIKPSVFTQQDVDEEKRAFDKEKKAYDYRSLKRKEVDVYGKERLDKPMVPSLLRTQPISQVNQKYLLTNSIIDSKVRISSMKNRAVMNSSNLAELRKEGPHQTMLRSIDMGHTLEELNERKTQMIQADITDSLSRDILIIPAEANFGVVKENGLYEIRIEVKNEDVMSQRITVKRPKTNMVKAFLNEMGPIPLGISRRVIVQLRATPEMKGKFSDQFQIVSKHEIYKIPVSAQIVSSDSFGSMSLKQPQQSLLKWGVTEIKQQASTLRGQKNLPTELPRIKE